MPHLPQYYTLDEDDHVTKFNISPDITAAFVDPCSRELPPPESNCAPDHFDRAEIKFYNITGNKLRFKYHGQDGFIILSTSGGAKNKTKCGRRKRMSKRMSKRISKRMSKRK